MVQCKQEFEIDLVIELLGDINLGYWEGCGVWQVLDVVEDFKVLFEIDLLVFFFYGMYDMLILFENVVMVFVGYSNGYLMVVEWVMYGIFVEFYCECFDFI